MGLSSEIVANEGRVALRGDPTLCSVMIEDVRSPSTGHRLVDHPGLPEDDVSAIEGDFRRLRVAGMHTHLLELDPCAPARAFEQLEPLTMRVVAQRECDAWPLGQRAGRLEPLHIHRLAEANHLLLERLSSDATLDPVVQGHDDLHELRQLWWKLDVEDVAVGYEHLRRMGKVMRQPVRHLSVLHEDGVGSIREIALVARDAHAKPLGGIRRLSVSERVKPDVVPQPLNMVGHGCDVGLAAAQPLKRHRREHELHGCAGTVCRVPNGRPRASRTSGGSAGRRLSNSAKVAARSTSESSTVRMLRAPARRGHPVRPTTKTKGLDRSRPFEVAGARFGSRYHRPRISVTSRHS